jgi:hypothetical protein
MAHTLSLSRGTVIINGNFEENSKLIKQRVLSPGIQCKKPERSGLLPA